MNKTLFLTIIAALFAIGIATPSYSAVDWETGFSLKTNTPPLDTAITRDGKWTFVLTEGGHINIYGHDGTLNDTIAVAPEIDHLAINGSGEELILTSKRTNSIQQLKVSFVAVINTDGAPSLGSPQAPVKIVLFSDFQCPYCSKVGSLLEYVLEHNPDTVRVVYKQFPLPFHKNALPAAIASLAAQEQGKFWELHDLLFENGKELSKDKIEALAKEAGLEMKRFNKDRTDAALLERVEQDIKDGQQAGVHGTPTIFVNGRSLKDRSPQGLQMLVDQELARIKKSNK